MVDVSVLKNFDFDLVVGGVLVGLFGDDEIAEVEDEDDFDERV